MKTHTRMQRFGKRAGRKVLNALLLLAILQTFQSLPHSHLMAGNVTASIDRQGDLEIRGDNDRDGNQFEMFVYSQGRLFREAFLVYVLRGKNGTTINDQAVDIFALEDVTGDVNINMGSGGDTVEIHDWYDVRTPLNEYVWETNSAAVGVGREWPMDNGNEVDSRLGRGAGNVDNNLNINTGGGNDTLDFHNVYLSNNLNINTGIGTDTLRSQPKAIFLPVQRGIFRFRAEPRYMRLYVGGNINIDTGYGDDDDDVILQYFIVRQQLHVETRGGDDTVWLHEGLAGWDGNSARILNIDTGAGNDDVILSYLELNQQLHVKTHDGSDYVWINETQIEEPSESRPNNISDDDLFVDTGNGQHDTIGIQSSFIIGNSGCDHVEGIERGARRGNVFLTSGTGTNVIFLDRLVAFDDLKIKGQSGKDYVYFYDISIWGSADLTLEDNRDFIFMDSCLIRHDLIVNTGGDNDLVHAQGLQETTTIGT